MVPPMTAPEQSGPTSPGIHQGRREKSGEDPPQKKKKGKVNPLAMEIPHELHSFLLSWILVLVLQTSTAGRDNPAVGALTQRKRDNVGRGKRQGGGERFGPFYVCGK